MTGSSFRATKLFTGDEGNEYGRGFPPERAGGGVKPGAGRGPKILPEPSAESEAPAIAGPGVIRTGRVSPLQRTPWREPQRMRGPGVPDK